MDSTIPTTSNTSCSNEDKMIHPNDSKNTKKRKKTGIVVARQLNFTKKSTGGILVELSREHMSSEFRNAKIDELKVLIEDRKMPNRVVLVKKNKVPIPCGTSDIIDIDVESDVSKEILTDPLLENEKSVVVDAIQAEQHKTLISDCADGNSTKYEEEEIGNCLDSKLPMTDDSVEDIATQSSLNTKDSNVHKIKRNSMRNKRKEVKNYEELISEKIAIDENKEAKELANDELGRDLVKDDSPQLDFGKLQTIENIVNKYTNFLPKIGNRMFSETRIETNEEGRRTTQTIEASEIINVDLLNEMVEPNIGSSEGGQIKKVGATKMESSEIINVDLLDENNELVEPSTGLLEGGQFGETKKVETKTTEASENSKLLEPSSFEYGQIGKTNRIETPINATLLDENNKLVKPSTGSLEGGQIGQTKKVDTQTIAASENHKLLEPSSFEYSQIGGIQTKINHNLLDENNKMVETSTGPLEGVQTKKVETQTIEVSENNNLLEPSSFEFGQIGGINKIETKTIETPMLDENNKMVEFGNDALEEEIEGLLVDPLEDIEISKTKISVDLETNIELSNEDIVAKKINRTLQTINNAIKVGRNQQSTNAKDSHTTKDQQPPLMAGKKRRKINDPKKKCDNKTKMCVEWSYDCEICKRKYKKHRTFRKHMRIEHPDIRISTENTQIEEHANFCDLCCKTFKKNSTLAAHKRLHVSNPKCNECDRQFRNHVTLTKHLMSVHFPKCDICGKPYEFEEEHMKMHRTSDTDPKYECHFCHQKFTEIANLKQHLTDHHIHKCAICEKDFLTRPQLLYHSRVHITCLYCKQLLKSRTIKTHLKSCTMLNPVKKKKKKGLKIKGTSENIPADGATCSDAEEMASKCDLCDIMMGDSQKCSICTLQFETADGFGVHMKTHVSDTTCRICKDKIQLIEDNSLLNAVSGAKPDPGYSYKKLNDNTNDCMPLVTSDVTDVDQNGTVDDISSKSDGELQIVTTDEEGIDLDYKDYDLTCKEEIGFDEESQTEINCIQDGNKKLMASNKEIKDCSNDKEPTNLLGNEEPIPNDITSSNNVEIVDETPISKATKSPVKPKSKSKKTPRKTRVCDNAISLNPPELEKIAPKIRIKRKCCSKEKIEKPKAALTVQPIISMLAVLPSKRFREILPRPVPMKIDNSEQEVQDPFQPVPNLQSFQNVRYPECAVNSTFHFDSKRGLPKKTRKMKRGKSTDKRIMSLKKTVVNINVIASPVTNAINSILIADSDSDDFEDDIEEKIDFSENKSFVVKNGVVEDLDYDNSLFDAAALNLKEEIIIIDSD